MDFLIPPLDYIEKNSMTPLTKSIFRLLIINTTLANVTFLFPCYGR